MAMSVLFISGCGGSIYNDSSDGKTDTYNAKTVLEGNWVIMNGSGSAVSTRLGTSDTLTFKMDHAEMTFSDVQINGDTGTAELYYSHGWRAFDTSEVYKGEFNITSGMTEDDSVKARSVSLTHVDSDNWRVYDAENEDNIIMITFNSASAITTSWEGLSSFSGTMSGDIYHYTIQCTFRKE